MRRARTCLPLAAIALLATLALAACGSSSSSSSSGGGTSTPAPAEGETSESGGGGIASAAVGTLLKYTGGKEEKADPSLSPITIGWVNEEGGVPSFPEMTAGAKAAVYVVNEELGGIDGHPVELTECTLQSEEDGQKCATQLLNAKVPVAGFGIGVGGDASFFQAIDGKIPVVLGVAGTPSDLTSPNTYNLSGGGPATLYGMSVNVAKDHPEKVALLSTDDPASKTSMGTFIEPLLKEQNVDFNKTVFFPATVTTPQMVSAIQASGAAEADAILANFGSPAQCLEAYEALTQLGIEKPVTIASICNGPEFVESTPNGPAEEWAQFGTHVNPRIENPETLAFKEVMKAAGQEEYVYTGFSPDAMSDVLSIVKFANALGPENLTPGGFEEQIEKFKGPAFMLIGDLDCANPPNSETPTVCGNATEGSEFSGGKWVPTGLIEIPPK
jgi:branched-chain amino acid transport system substrate-binding protein